MERVFRWPRAFPPSTPRALPASSSTSCRSVPCARPTPRRTAADCCFRLPAHACESPSARRPLRGLPVPVHETCVGLPNSLTPGGARSPCPHSSDSRHGHPHIMRALAPPNIVFRGSITRPAHAPSYASQCRSPCTAQGRGFRGVDSSPGRTCSTLDFSCIFTHLLSHAGFPPAHHNAQCRPFVRPDTEGRTQVRTVTRSHRFIKPYVRAVLPSSKSCSITGRIRTPPTSAARRRFIARPLRQARAELRASIRPRS